MSNLYLDVEPKLRAVMLTRHAYEHVFANLELQKKTDMAPSTKKVADKKEPTDGLLCSHALMEDVPRMDGFGLLGMNTAMYERKLCSMICSMQGPHPLAN